MRAQRFFGPGVSENIMLKSEVQELSSMSLHNSKQRWLRMSWLQWIQILVSRCFIDIKDFIKLSMNISEELETQLIKVPDAKQHEAWNYGLRSFTTSRPWTSGNETFYRIGS